MACALDQGLERTGVSARACLCRGSGSPSRTLFACPNTPRERGLFFPEVAGQPGMEPSRQRACHWLSRHRYHHHTACVLRTRMTVVVAPHGGAKTRPNNTNCTVQRSCSSRIRYLAPLATTSLGS